MNSDILSFRCIHRHTAESHPQCYQRFLRGGKHKQFTNQTPKTRQIRKNFAFRH